MHTVEVLEQAVDLAVRLGYTVRQDSFAGSGGGACELKGRKFLFLDLDLGPDERLEQTIAALQHEPKVQGFPVSQELGELLKLRKTA
jgi:hypothetical protein